MNPGMDVDVVDVNGTQCAVPNHCAQNSAKRAKAPASANAEVAARWAGVGATLVPSRTRIPVVAGWSDIEASPASQIAAWDVEFPGSDFSIVTHRHVRLDVDNKHGRAGEARLDALTRRKVREASPCVTLTPSGGLHAAFSWWPGVPALSRVNGPCDAVDVRGCRADGKGTGLAVAPGMVTERGEYVMLRERFVPLADLPLPPLEYAWLIALDRFDRQRLRARRDARDLFYAGPYVWLETLDAMLTEEREKAAATARSAGALSAIAHVGYRAQAEDDLVDWTNRLAAKTHGRKDSAFRFAAKLGSYVAHGVLAKDHVLERFRAALIANGATGKHGWQSLKKDVENGIRKAESDRLPPLAREYRGHGK